MAEMVLEAAGLVKSYRQGEAPVEVLHGVDFRLQAGELVVVLGPSGSGKSTLLNLLGLMDRPSQGEVMVQGQKTAALDDERRAGLRNRAIGFVFQFDSLLPEFTALENVMMPALIARRRTLALPETIEERARELMDRAGIGALAGRFPSQLSGGERQRAAIARALVNRPGVVLADEPTGNLDRRNGELVFSRLRELAEGLGVAVVLVTHNEAAAQFGSRTIHLVDGRIDA